jgi:predicted nucleic acid-binding protein
VTRVFFDANVLISASLRPDGRSAALIEVVNADHEPVISSHVAEECKRNVLHRYPERFEHLESLLADLRIVSEAPEAVVTWARDLGLPDADAPVLAAAVACRAEVLVTGDKRHFGALFSTTVRDVEVTGVAELLNRLLSE